MSFVGDSRRPDGKGPGILPGQHHGFVGDGWPLANRASVLIQRIVGRQDGQGEIGHWENEGDVLGDWTGLMSWPNNSRDLPAWREVFPAIAVAGASSTTKSRGSSVSTTGSATDSGLAALPIWDEYATADTRFRPIPFEVPRGFPIPPRGAVGLVVQGMDEDRQRNRWHSTDPRLIAVNYDGDPEMGSLVFDLDSKGRIDPDRGARLQSLVRVCRAPGFGDVVGQNILAWQIGPSGLGDTFGGFICDYVKSRRGLNGVSSPIFADVSLTGGGPICVGAADDVHQLARDADGNPINSAHLGLNALYYDEWAGVDAPEEFNGDYAPTQSGPFRMRVRKEIDRGATHNHVTGKKPQLLRWSSDGLYYTPTGGPPPTTGEPPKPPPEEPKPPPNVPEKPGEPPPTYSGPGEEPAWGFLAPGSLKYDPETGGLKGDVIKDSGEHGGSPGDAKGGKGAGGAAPGGVVNVGWGPKIKPWKWKGLKDLFNLFGGGWKWGPSDRHDANPGIAAHERVKSLDLRPLGPRDPNVPPPKAGEDPNKGREKVGPTQSPGFKSGDLGLKGGIPVGPTPSSRGGVIRGPSTLAIPPGPTQYPTPGGAELVHPPVRPGEPGIRRPVPATTVQIASPSFYGRPQHISAGSTDLRWDLEPRAADVQRHDRTAPLVAHVEAWGNQGNAAVGSILSSPANEWDLTRQAWSGPALVSPTANGGFCVMPPEVDMADVDTDFTPTWTSKSTTYWNVLTGCYHSAGLPNLATGGIRKGHRWGEDTSGNLIFSRVDTAGTVTQQASINADGTTTGFGNEFGVIKPADQSVSNATTGTTLVDCTGMTQAILASAQWKFKFYLTASAGLGTTGIKVAVTVPAGATILVRGVMTDTGGATRAGTANASGTAIDFTAAMFAGGTAVIVVEGAVLNGGTAGAIQLQFAQSTASATQTTVAGGSDGNFTKVA